MRLLATLLASAAVFVATAAVAADAVEFGAIVIDPGHGGEDLGAVVRGRHEKDIALQVARKLRARLERYGATARLTRDTDVYIPLDKRLASVDDSAAAFVSLHLNKVPQKKPSGITIFSFGRQSVRLPAGRRLGVPPLPDPPREIAKAGAKLARAISRALSKQGFQVDPLERAGFYVLKNPTVPSVLIELGYMSNPREIARLTDPAYQDRLADALAVSLRSHLMSARAATAVTAGR